MVLLTSGTLHETEQEAPATMCNSPPHKHSQASHCMHVYSPLLGNLYAWGGSMWRLLPSRFARSKWPPLHDAVVKSSISGDWYQVWAKVGEDIIVLQGGDPDYFWRLIPGMGKSWRRHYSPPKWWPRLLLEINPRYGQKLETPLLYCPPKWWPQRYLSLNKVFLTSGTLRLSKTLLPPCATLIHINNNILKHLTLNACLHTSAWQPLCLGGSYMWSKWCHYSAVVKTLPLVGHDLEFNSSSG